MSLPRTMGREGLGWVGVAAEVGVYVGAAWGIDRLARALPLHASMFREHARYEAETPLWLLRFLAIHVALFVVVRTIAGWRRVELGLGSPLSGMRENTALGFVVLAITNVGMCVIPGVTDQAWAAYGMRSSSDLLVFLLWISPVVAGIGEEVVFRAMLQGRLIEAHPAWGVVAAALVFALLHRFQGLVPLLGMHVPASLLFAIVYAQRRDLASQIVSHAAYDIVVFGELWLVHAAGLPRLAVCGALLAIAIAGVIGFRADLGRIVGWSRDLGRALWAGRRSALFAAIAIPLLLYLFELEKR